MKKLSSVIFSKWYFLEEVKKKREIYEQQFH